jgi:hypothetical protein
MDAVSRTVLVEATLLLSTPLLLNKSFYLILPHSLRLTTVITSVPSGTMNDNGTEVKNQSLLGLESEEVNNLFIAREKYDRAVQEKNAGLPLERRIFKISIKKFIEESVLSLISELKLQIPEDEIDIDRSIKEA